MDVSLILIIIMFALSAFFSGSEVAIISISHLKAKQLVSQRIPRSKKLLYLKENQGETLITILIGNNVVNIIAAVLATEFTLEFLGDHYLSIATGILTFLTLTFGDIMPKVLASKNTKKVALFVAPIIYYLMQIIYPVVWFFNLIIKLANKIGKKKTNEPLVTEQEIKYMVKIGEEEGEINEREKEIIHNVFKFNDTTIEKVMTKREEVFALEWDMKIKDALPLLAEQAFTRIPVYDENINKMKGVVRVQDVMEIVLRKETDKTLRSLVSHTVFVHSHQKIDYVMRMMQLRHVHMAIVIDKKRKFMGLATMEDILEELVGEIFDESDRVDYLVKRIAKKEWLVNTRVEIRVINKRLGLHIPITDNFKSLATFLKENMMPIKKGKEYMFEKDNVVFVARKVFEGNVQQVIIRKK
ncbi:MAG: hemolysin family protein [Candidatus Woesearchaeota archaeon]